MIEEITENFQEGDLISFTLGNEKTGIPKLNNKVFEGKVVRNYQLDSERCIIEVTNLNDLNYLIGVYGKIGLLAKNQISAKKINCKLIQSVPKNENSSDFKLCFELETLIDMISSRINTSNFSIVKSGEEYGVIIEDKTIINQSLFACLKEIENESRI